MQQIGATRSSSSGRIPSGLLILVLSISIIPLASQDAAATYTSCFTINQYGWKGEIGTSSNAGLMVKDLKEDGTYYVEVVNVPWIDLDVGADSDVLRVFGATLVSCTGTDYSTYYQVDAYFATGSGASNNDGYAQNFHIYVTYGEDYVIVVTYTLSGATKQAHPFYWDVAPCAGCGTVDRTDDSITVDASTGAGTTNVAWQNKETQLSEMLYRNYVYKVFDGGSTYMMSFWAYDFSTDGEAERTDAWALKCTSCGESSTQYNSGPWDFQTNEAISSVDVQLVIQNTRYTGSGGWITSSRLQI